MSDHQEAKQATPPETLLAELLDSRIPKSEREHAAAREIERLTAEREVLRTLLIRARDMLDWVGGSCEGIDKTVQMVEAFQAEIDAQIEQEKANGSR